MQSRTWPVTSALVHYGSRLCLIWACMVTPGMAATDPDITQLESLIASGKNQPAMELASQLQATHEGEPAFDFLFGLAALSVGQYHIAIFALERVTLADPTNPRAKLELARAYFLIGEYQAAEPLFQEVMAMEPPESVKQNIQFFLTDIGLRRNEFLSKTNAYVGLHAGYDSNINSATSITGFQLGGLQLKLRDESRAIEDGFVELKAGANHLQPVNLNHNYFIGSQFSSRTNLFKNYDLAQLTLSGGIQLYTDYGRWRLPLQMNTMWLDGKSYQSLASITSELGTANERSEDAWYLQYAQANFPDTAYRDYSMTVLGWNQQRLLAGNLPHTLQFGAYLAQDRPFSAVGAAASERIYLGVSIGAEWRWGSPYSVEAALQWQNSQYTLVQPLFNQMRNDLFGHFELTWHDQINKKWAWDLHTELSQNRSSLPLYTYDRWQVTSGITLSY